MAIEDTHFLKKIYLQMMQMMSVCNHFHQLRQPYAPNLINLPGLNIGGNHRIPIRQ